MKVSLIVESNAANLTEKINFFIKDIPKDKLIDIKFSTDAGDMESWYNALIIYEK